MTPERTPRPAPCGGGLTHADFAIYLDALNRRDWAACARFYAPSLTVIYHGGDPLDRAAHLADLAAKAERARDVLTLHEFAVGQDGVSAAIEIERTALRDGVEGMPEPFRRGQSIRFLDVSFFDVTAGLIHQISTTTMERLA